MNNQYIFNHLVLNKKPDKSDKKYLKPNSNPLKTTQKFKILQIFKDIIINHYENPQQLRNIEDIQTLINQIQNKSDTNQKINYKQEIVLHKILLNDLEYQNQIIREKELDLVIIQEEAKLNSLKNRLRNTLSPLIIQSEEINKLKKNIAEKTQYIRTYEDYLNQKFESEGAFQKSSLEKKLSKQVDKLIAMHHHQLNNLDQLHLKTINELNDHREKQNNILDKIKKLRLSKEDAIIQYQRLVNQYNRQIDQYKIEIEIYNKINSQIESLEKQEKEIKVEIKKLKNIILVEEEHDKACLVIERAIILKQTQKIRQQVDKRKVNNELEEKIPKLKQMIKQKEKQNEILYKRIEERNKTLEEYKERLNEKIEQFNSLDEKFRTSYKNFP